MLYAFCALLMLLLSPTFFCIWVGFSGYFVVFFIPPPSIQPPVVCAPVCVCVCGLNYSRITMTRLCLHYLGCRAKKYAVTTEWRGSGMAVAKSRPHVCPRLRLGVHCAANRCPSGTPSECLFFFGIYSFTSVNRKTRSSNFWRRQRHPFHIPQKLHSVGSLHRITPSDHRSSTLTRSRTTRSHLRCHFGFVTL